MIMKGFVQWESSHQHDLFAVEKARPKPGTVRSVASA